MNVLHLLTVLVATWMVEVTECFVLPQSTHSKPAEWSTAGDGAGGLRGGQMRQLDWLQSGTVGGDQHQMPQMPNDRSVYDPGVDNIPLSAFFEQHSKSGQQLLDNAIAGGQEPDSVETDDGELLAAPEQAELLRQLEAHIKEDADIAAKSAVILKWLETAKSDDPMPLVYVDDEPDEAPEPVGLEKRSGRYYRRYPWKRQNTRYESEQRYLCVPSRNDVLKLLIGLDEGRKGNHGRTVNFCNRKRPAKAIFSNIRFLG